MRRSAEPTRASVAGPHGPLTLTVRRSARARRATLKLDRVAGGAVLVVPERMALAQALAFAESKADWLDAALATLPAPMPVLPGARLPLRGVPVTVRHDPQAPRAPRVADDTLVLGGPAELAGRRLARWLKDQARTDLVPAVAVHAERLGLSHRVARLTVKDTRRQWGSASPKGALSFSWRLILAPPFVLDYLAAHEVAHLGQMNHSPRFWALVDRTTPDRRRAEAWLKRSGAGLFAYRLVEGSGPPPSASV
ncbi:hypothetical protein CCR85_11590 [Rhodothalassium salexigens]|uniref:M48 family metallopeptidase n=1 Tax=Rhodothalassium salexigens TaxID=1086 RepID=UPI001912B091|nr:SprT family zinc-dependent metalloprotease [Rhodothalassium salexigens]MBK5912130.1 hypothetical protein [Rhodothalassium salexigens]